MAENDVAILDRRTLLGVAAAGLGSNLHPRGCAQRERREELRGPHCPEIWPARCGIQQRAGITRENRYTINNSQEWDDVINTNLRGVFLAIK